MTSTSSLPKERTRRRSLRKSLSRLITAFHRADILERRDGGLVCRDEVLVVRELLRCSRAYGDLARYCGRLADWHATAGVPLLVGWAFCF